MKVHELKKLLEHCEDDWDICYTSNASLDDGIVDIDEMNEAHEYPRTYILF